MAEALGLQSHRVVMSNQGGSEREISALCELRQPSPADRDIPEASSRTRKEQPSVQLCNCAAFLRLVFVRPAHLLDDCYNSSEVHRHHLLSVPEHQPRPCLYTANRINR